jgi:hypothetical protein
MIKEKIKRDFKNIGENRDLLALVLLTQRIKNLKTFIEDKINKKDKWSIYSGECRAYREVLEELDRFMK